MRYSRNEKMLTQEENNKLCEFKVCVVGCGGLGGYVIEMLGRLGIGKITVIDGDVFDETNLNRQLISNENNIGLYKSLEAKKRMNIVNKDLIIEAICENLNEVNALKLLSGHHIIIDALDSILSRKVLQKAAKEIGIPFVHGAISGWYGQVTTVFPDDDTLSKLYETIDGEVDNPLGNPSFTPALVASLQVSEALKVLLNRGELLRQKVLLIDMYENNYEVMTL